MEKHPFQHDAPGKDTLKKEHNDSAENTAFPVFDRASLLQRTLNNEELLTRILQAFCSNIPVTLTQLKKAVEDHNTPETKLYIHSIKGTAANVSAVSMSEVAKRLEIAAADNDMDLVIKLLPELEKTFSEFQKIAG